MDIDLESCFFGFLIGVAIYLLLNKVFMVEGVTTTKHCNTGACAVKGQYCYYEPKCDPNDQNFNGGTGCNAGGIDQKCRFCGFGDYIDIDCDDKIELTMIIRNAYKSTQYSNEVNYLSLEFNFDTDSYERFKSLLDRNNDNSFISLHDDPYNVGHNNGPIHLYFTFTDYMHNQGIDHLDISYIVKIINCFKEDINGIGGDILTGNLSALSSLHDLQSLYFGDNTGVTGKLSALSNLQDLQYLDLNYTGVTGELGDLKKLNRLWHLDLGGVTGVTGKLGDLSDLSSLEFLHLSSEGVTGELGDLKKLNRLWHLDLGGVTGVTGNLSALSNDLNWLDLSFTGVTGNLSDLSSLDLSWLKLTDVTGVTGELGVLSGLQGLQHLDLGGVTGVAGNLSALSNLHDLHHLFLNDTGVTGVLGDLNGLSSLQILDLGDVTGVTGVLHDLNGLSSLMRLYLCPNPGITGDVSDSPVIYNVYKKGNTDLDNCINVTDKSVKKNRL